jgi:hypothetical protein
LNMSTFFKNLLSFGSPLVDENGDTTTTADGSASAPAGAMKDPKVRAAAAAVEQQQQQQQNGSNDAHHHPDQVDDTAHHSALPALKMHLSPQHIPRRPAPKDLLRVRSLSKVFNQLPLVLPNLTEIQLDVVEWYCHVCLLETDAGRLNYLVQQLSRALGEHQPRMYGRLYNRLHMVALWSDICSLPTIGNAGLGGDGGRGLGGGGGGGGAPSPRRAVHSHQMHHDNDSTAAPSGMNGNTNTEHEHERSTDICVSADQWQQVREQLVLVKSYLLRQDANLPVPTLQQVGAATAIHVSDHDTDADHKDGDAEDHEYAVVPACQAAPDGQLEKHDMFQQDYQQVVLLLHVHQVLAKFKESLQKIASSESSPSSQQHSNPKDNIHAVNKRAEQAIDAYENSLFTVFENHHQTAATLNHNANGNHTTEQAIPKELTAFLLRDLYQQKRTSLGSHTSNSTDANKNQPVTDLVTSLQDHVRNMCLNAASEYSHASLKQRVRTHHVILYYQTVENETKELVIVTVARLFGISLAFITYFHLFRFPSVADARPLNQMVREYSGYSSLGITGIRRCHQSCCGERR